MAKKPRLHSQSGYYHVTCRGTGKMIIFEEEKDKKYLINLFRKYKEKYNISIIAYCLMSNHFHLILYDPKNNLSLFMMCVETCFAMRFNYRNGREGRLFQGRFRSKCIEDEDYFLRACKYVLRNPEAASLCRADQYIWSSYYDFCRSKPVSDYKVLFKKIGGLENYKKYVAEESTFRYVTHKRSSKLDKNPMSDVNRFAYKKAQALLGVKFCGCIQGYPRERRDSCIKKLFDREITPVQISKITGIGLNIIYKITRKCKGNYKGNYKDNNSNNIENGLLRNKRKGGWSDFVLNTYKFNNTFFGCPDYG